jgi:GTP-binding protein Era
MKSGTAVIIGRPNSGKSTLLNALAGQKVSIVSSKPQTTRHRIIGVINEERGQVVFVDTPGVHKPVFRMNQRMLQTVYEEISGVDLVLHMVDSGIPFGAGENFVLEMVKSSGAPAFLLLNKIDSIAKQRLLPAMERYGRAGCFMEIIPISAASGENLDLLLDKIFEYMPEGEPRYDGDMVTDRTERFLAGEFIREKLLERLREELPYASAVMVRRFDESRRSDKNLVVIDADILVERRSQQGIVLGAGARTLRDLGTEARRDLEQMLGCKVYLGIQVRTAHNWRNDESVLDELGLGS